MLCCGVLLCLLILLKTSIPSLLYIPSQPSFPFQLHDSILPILETNTTMTPFACSIYVFPSLQNPPFVSDVNPQPITTHPPRQNTPCRRSLIQNCPITKLDGDDKRPQFLSNGVMMHRPCAFRWERRAGLHGFRSMSFGVQFSALNHQ